jgi:uncharacterized lipoprotein YbaY
MNRWTTRLSPLIVVTAWIGGCTTARTSATQARVVGTVSLPDGAELDERTVVVISLVDLDRMDVVNQIQQQPEQQTIPFTVAYDRSDIVSSHEYAVEAVVIERGRPRYKNEPLDRVITQGNPAKIEVVVEPFD